MKFIDFPTIQHRASFNYYIGKAEKDPKAAAMKGKVEQYDLQIFISDSPKTLPFNGGLGSADNLLNLPPEASYALSWV